MQSWAVDSDEYGGPQHRNPLIMTNSDALPDAKSVPPPHSTAITCG